MASLPVRSLALSLGLVPLALSGCETPPAPDAGSDAPVAFDAGPPPPPYTCEGEPTVLEGVLGATETVEFDTRMTDERPRDLGLACGNTEAAIRWARQEVIEYLVPGSGPVSVEFSAVNTGTDPNFDTLIQVRRDCSSVPTLAFPPTCFDNATMSEVRSAGAFQAMGGDTLYFIVTGHSSPEPVTGNVDEGTIQVTLTPRANTPPTIISASSILNGAANIISAQANDAEGPIFGFALKLYTAAGQIDFDGDGDGDDQDVLIFQFETVTGSGPYDGNSVITPEMDGYRLADYCRAVGCTEAGIAVFDRQYAVSTFLRTPITDGIVVGVGETCDLTRICGSGLECFAGTCRLTAAAMTACGAASTFPIAVPTEVGVPSVASVTGSIARGMGAFSSPCALGAEPATVSTGREAIYRIDIPNPGTYTLELTTDRPGTNDMNDTLLYVRRGECLDGSPAASVGCNDDISRSIPQSRVTATVTAGVYWAFVEFYRGETAAPFELQATLTLTAAGDAGMPAVDAGMPDAGVPDAGGPDAGDVDAGDIDAPAPSGL